MSDNCMTCGLHRSAHQLFDARTIADDRWHPFHPDDFESRRRHDSKERAMADDNTISKTFRIPPELDRRLKKAAEERLVGEGLLIRTALERLLDHLVPVEELLGTTETGVAPERER